MFSDVEALNASNASCSVRQNQQQDIELNANDNMLTVTKYSVGVMFSLFNILV